MSFPTKKLTPPPFLHASPHLSLDCRPHIVKLSNSFYTFLLKTLTVVHIFSLIFRIYLKKFIGIKSLSTKQCPAELPPWIIPLVSSILSNMYHLLSSCLFPPPCMECPVCSPNWGKPCRWGKNTAQQQKLFSFPAPGTSSSPNSNFHVITQYKLHL